MVRIIFFTVSTFLLLSCHFESNLPDCSCGDVNYVSIRMYDGLEITDDYHGVMEIKEIQSSSFRHKTWHIKMCQSWNNCREYEKDVDGFEIIKIIPDWNK